MTTEVIPYQPSAALPWQRYMQRVAIALAAVVLLAWTVFPFVWILLTSLKNPGDILSVPPKFVFSPTFDNYAALVMGEQRGQYSSTRPDFPLFFLNSLIISLGAVALSVVAGIPAAYALARFTFPGKDGLAFVLMSFRFVPFIAFVIPLYLLYQRLDLYNTHAGLIFAYQLITLPFTIWMLRSFFQEIPLEIQEAAKIDGCSWLGVLTRVVLPLSMPGIAVTVILGNGSVLPCCQCTEPIDQVSSDRKFSEVWASENYAGFRKAAKQLPMPNERLKTCECDNCQLRPRNIAIHNFLHPLKPIESGDDVQTFTPKDFLRKMRGQHGRPPV